MARNNLPLTVNGSDNTIIFPVSIFVQFFKGTQKLGQHDPQLCNIKIKLNVLKKFSSGGQKKKKREKKN